MSLPRPEPGLVIRYAYLWHSEAAAGQEEGSKDRPCAIVLAVAEGDGQKRVYALPITHTPPRAAAHGVEIPRPVKVRLNLDSDRSWVLVSEANVFTWPGPDLRPVPGKGVESVAYGFLPPRLFRLVRDRFLALSSAERTALTQRSE